MAKLTDRKRNNIVAKWKTGVYTQRELAKTYNVDVATINKIVKEIPKENADLVEAGVVFENAKKSTKSQQEISEINKAIEYRLTKEFSEDNKKVKIYDTSFKILDLVNSILKKGTVEDKISVGDGIQKFEDRRLNANDAEKLANTVDKISVTTNVNPRHANTNIKVDNNNLQQTNLSIEDISLAIANGLPD